MVSGFDLTETAINRAVRSLLADGVTERDINAILLSVALRRWHDELGEDALRHVLQCEINQIDEGAYRPDYVSPEARMLDEEDAIERRARLVVIEGGGE
jgi:hypothetical protein